MYKARASVELKLPKIQPTKATLSMLLILIRLSLVPPFYSGKCDLPLNVT